MRSSGSIFGHDPAQVLERLMPHPVIPGAFFGASESAVFEPEDATAWGAAKVDVHASIGCADGRFHLPYIADLI